MAKQSNGQHINCDAMDFVLCVTEEAGADFVSHTYFFDFICDEMICITIEYGPNSLVHAL